MLTVLAVGYWHHFGRNRNIGRGRVIDVLQIDRELLTLLPLADYERRAAGVGEGAFLEVDGPDDRGIVRRRQCVADGRRLVDVFGALEHVERDLEQGMAEAKRHGPLFATRRFVPVAKLLRRLSGKPRLVGMGRRPPYLNRKAPCALAKRLDGRGKFGSLGDRHYLRLEILLRGGTGKGSEFRRR